MYLDNKTIFLAGSTGMVGSGIMRYILDNYPTTRIRAGFRNTKPFIRDERVDYVCGDLLSREDSRRMSRGCDCAIMAAANTAGSKAITSKPWEQVNDNIIMNTRMLEAFHFENVRRVVFIGSASLYQEFEGRIAEDNLDLNVEPHPAYLGVGWGFRFIEKLCKFWHEYSGMETIIVRAANIFGPYAKFDPSVSNFIPALIRKAVEKKDPFEVWGAPDIARDVIYSQDFSRAIAMMLDNGNIKFDVFNVGSGLKVTVGDVVNAALKYAGHKPSEIKYVSKGPVTIKFRELDCSKIKRELGWNPQYALEEGIRETTEWWVENKGRWRK